MKKNILFVSEIKDPYYKDFSSTQIMTNNIIDGLIQAAEHMTFVALVDANCNEKNVIEYYSRKVDKVYIIHSHLNLTLTDNKYIKLARVVQSWKFSGQYKKDLEALFQEENNFDLLISHSPTVEVISISKQIQEKFKLNYIQYWSDPYAVAGILPENMGIKRVVQKCLEKSMLKIADDVVYGTRTLMEFQKEIFPELANKMRYVDVSYCDMAGSEEKKDSDKLQIIYSGDYYTSIRNIEPFYEAAKEIENCHFRIIGKSDLKLDTTDDVEVLERRPYQEVLKYENESDVIVCLLNHSCVQIPGKIFYRVNAKQHILIILDGAYQEKFRNYLESFGRFEFCENNKESIKKCISEIVKKPALVETQLLEQLSAKRVGEEIVNGK